MLAEIIVNRPIQRRPPGGTGPLRDETPQPAAFTYRLPERLRGTAAMGQLVQVPLRASTALGIITGLDTARPPDLETEDIREVLEILDPLPVVTPVQVELARWIAERYLQPLSQAIRLFLPPGLEARTFVRVQASRPDASANEGQKELTGSERATLRYLQSRRSVRLDALLRTIHTEDPQSVVDALAERGLLETRYTFVPPKPAPPRIQFVRLLADDETVKAALPRLGATSKRADVLIALDRNTGAPLTLNEVCTRAGCSQGLVRGLAKQGWVKITERRTLVIAAPDASDRSAEVLGRAPRQKLALSAILERGTATDVAELRTDGRVTPSSLAALERKGLIQRIAEEPTVLLLLPRDSLLDQIVELRRSSVHRAVLELLRNSPGRVWVGGVYAQTGADLATLRALAEQGLVSLHAEEYERRQPTEPEPFHALTPRQKTVWEAIQQGLDLGKESGKPLVALIHGVTGSGKTEIYLRALRSILDAGKRAIILVPEISLTAQAVRRFEARFPGRVAVVHSQLSLGRRYDVWDKIRRGEADVIVGSRAALFTPVTRLGLIVLDESHDSSYKQAEPIPLPPYQSRDVARRLGQLAGATVLLGSATPDVVTYYEAQRGHMRLLELPERIVTGDAAVVLPGRRRPQVTLNLPPVRVVDLRQELRTGNRSIFSRALQAGLVQSLAAGEQAILFLNRRGSATFVLCRTCGYVARCVNCDVPLTFHYLGPGAETGQLICHHCNHSEPTTDRCPECGSRRIRHFGLGTEQVEMTLRKLHPEVRLLRWDSDTARGPDHERFLQAFVDHRADVLIGTQMIAKGLDLPLVTLVGVISADTALNLPDYRTPERTFQLLTQVAGRAGRSQRGGRVIVQTYNPDHYAVRFAASHDYASFCAQELEHRRTLGYPPFSRLVALRYASQDLAQCRSESERLAAWLTAEIRRLDRSESLIGPAPCFHSRLHGRHRWQIVVRGPDPAGLLEHVALPAGWRADVDPESLL